MARGPWRGWNRWKRLGILMSQQAFTIILHHWKFFIFQNSSYPNMADLHQFLKSPQNNSNAAKQSLYTMFQHQNTHRRSDIVIQWYTFFHISLFWCKPALNELFVCPEKIIILWNYLSLFLWAISCILPLLHMLPLRGRDCSLWSKSSAYIGLYLVLCTSLACCLPPGLLRIKFIPKFWIWLLAIKSQCTVQSTVRELKEGSHHCFKVLV